MSIFDKISTQEKIDFARNLALLMRSGSPIDKSFSILADQSKPVLKKFLLEGKLKIEKGVPISEVLEKNPNFDKIFINFIRAGEISGTLSKNLEFLINWLEGRNSLEKEISSATLYPKIIVTFALVIGIGLAFFVLPQMTQIFGSLDVDIPFTTQLLLDISDFIASNTLLNFLLLVFFIVLILFLIKLRPIKDFLHKIFIRLPIFGSLFKEYQLAVITHLIGVLLRSGFTINRTLEVVGNSITNVEYKKAIDETMIRIAKGTSFFQAIKNYPNLFPGIFISVVSVGEETGSLTESFDYLADYFNEKVREKTAKLPTVIEPILLIVIGLFVAFIVSSLVLPIYEMTRDF